MKMAKLYFSKADLASKWGINPEDFIIGQSKTDYDSLEFDVIFINDVETKEIEIADIVDSTLNVRRQRL